MKIKLLVSLLVASIFSLYANTKTNDLMNIRINENVILKNGYGTISGKPILNDKSLEEKLYLRGEFNVDEKNNASFEFNKLEHEGKIYNLNNAFVKKGRLRNTNITLKKDSNLTVSGGNKDEILSILNAIDQQDRKDNKDLSNEEKNGNTSFSSSPGGTSNSTPAFSPSLVKDDNKDNEKSTTNANSSSDKNSAVVVTCPDASYDGNIATYYIQLGTICTKRTSLSVKTIYNSNSCKSKVDYTNNKIELGFEVFAVDPEGGSFLVQRCQYKEPIDLIAKVKNCKAIPNYETNKAEVQKQYSYIWEKEEKDVGDCTPTGEIVPLEYEINSCEEERHDFEKKISIEQGQYFYNYENKKIKAGTCVDIPKYTYNHFQDDSTCKYDIDQKTGVVFYRERVAYNDLNGVKLYATDCQVKDSGKLIIQEEFVGYEFHPETKQALRKINTYFITPTTKKKIYIDKNITTKESYQYVETECKVVNDDTARTTTRWSEIYFNDTDENKKVVVNDCSPKTTIGYTQISGTGSGVFEDDLGFKQLTKRADGKFFVTGEPEKTIDHGNGLFPSNKGRTEDITTVRLNETCQRSTGLIVSDGTCIGGTISSKTLIERCGWGNVVSSGVRDYPYANKTCTYFDYWEKIARYSIQATYLRGDGSTLEMEAQKLYKITR